MSFDRAWILVFAVAPIIWAAREWRVAVRRGAVRRAKLYYLRDRRGKSARIAERAQNTVKAETAETTEG